MFKPANTVSRKRSVLLFAYFSSCVSKFLNYANEEYMLFGSVHTCYYELCIQIETSAILAINKLIVFNELQDTCLKQEF